MDPKRIDPHPASLIPGVFVLGLFLVAVFIIPMWQICKKAGFSPWLCLLVLVPFGALILLYIVAFAQWKVAPLPQYALGYPPNAYPPAYPPAAPPPSNPNEPYPRG